MEQSGAYQPVDQLITALKAAAEPTRLRILLLLASGELNVKDLTRILGQSQPRISRHLKLLAEGGLVQRSREGSWVYFRLPDSASGSDLAAHLVSLVSPSDPTLVRDRQRADAVKREREQSAQVFFDDHAAEWDKIRALHVAESDVEAAMVKAMTDNGRSAPLDLLVDIGTGTGRILELFAKHYTRGIGLDLNPAMLAYARAKLERAGIAHAHVRQADIYDLPLADGVAGAVVIHQILHFLSDPARAIAEAARIVAPGGKILIVDFAPHDLEFLRETQAHERLGFARATVSDWLVECGLSVIECRDLKPSSPGDTNLLTVSLWVAERPATGTKSTSSNTPQTAHKLERIS
jgi:ubiquinone/menaquinone biosynthesis C-methylase UbiE/DNA-binding transcriptional ArsR family regulator